MKGEVTRLCCITEKMRYETSVASIESHIFNASHPLRLAVVVSNKLVSEH